MLETKIWQCAPQVRDLPRDLEIVVTCTCCGARRAMAVREMVEERRLGAQFMDLLEWEMRCEDDNCGGQVRFDYAGKPEMEAPRMVTLPRPKPVERLPLLVKAVVKRRVFSPQYALPMALPVMADRRIQARRVGA